MIEQPTTPGISFLKMQQAIDLMIRMGALAAVHNVSHWGLWGKSHLDFPAIWNQRASNRRNNKTGNE